MQTQIAVFTVVVPLHLRGGALWCTFQWLVKENFCNWTQKQEKKTRVCAKHECTSCQEGSQNRLKRRVLQKRISAKDAAQTGLVQNIFSFPRQLLIPIAIWERASVFLGNVQIEAKKIRLTQNISSNYRLCLSALIFRLSHTGLCSACAVSFLAPAWNLLELRWFVGKLATFLKESFWWIYYLSGNSGQPLRRKKSGLCPGSYRKRGKNQDKEK